MNYPSIRIEGAILSPDIFDRIEELPGQKPTDFGLDSSARVKDEIARAWADAQDYWRIFRRKLGALNPESPATTETRQQWVVPLLGLLGYQLEYQARGVELRGKTYAISHRVTNRAQAPVQIVGYREPAGLDRRPERLHARMSAHAVVQEFINLNDQLYGLVTNGRVIRLLRDSSRLIKLSYLEFDLDRIFTDGLFADFAIFYRLLHATRLPQTNDDAAESLIERYHQDSLDSGARVRAGLRETVTEALELLGTAFVSHPANLTLRGEVESGSLKPDQLFGYLLRLVYRLLFLNVVEERGLLFPKDAAVSHLHTYYEFYSVQRLRRLARLRWPKTERHHDAWLSLLATFQLFERSDQASKLGTTAFGGQLFDPDGLGPLKNCRLSNAALFHALDRLCSFDDPLTHQRRPISFGALATEELGSVYESLLELHPIVERAPSARFGFKQSAGNDRKSSGSYYTPAHLVDSLLDTVLDPILDRHIMDYRALGYPSAETAILALRVCDPACGSGHFLIAAAQRIARRLAVVRADDNEPSPDQVRHALRQVIGRCIYAVDVNPMAVELCRVALWLEGVEPGKPLSFIDHHIRVGNSLIGATAELIASGIPDAAFDAADGDDKRACTILRRRNRAELEGAGGLFAQEDQETQARLQQAAAVLAELPDDLPLDVARKETVFRQYERTEEYRHKKTIADVWCAAFAVRKYFREPGVERSVSGITQGLLNRLASHSVPTRDHHLLDDAQQLSIQHGFFHWHLAFPEVFAKGGFHVVLANPPWVSFTGRQKVDISQEALRLLLGRFPCVGRWPATHPALLVLSTQLLASSGRAGLVLPKQIADLAAYGPARAEVTGVAELAAPVVDVGEHSFPGVTQPVGLFTFIARNAGGDRLETPWPCASLRHAHEDGNHPAVGAPASLARLGTLASALRDRPRFPPKTFADPGVHTGNVSKKIVVGEPPVPSDSYVLVREGRDIAAFVCGVPTKWLWTAPVLAEGEYCTVRSRDRYTNVPILLRQTADRPIAARHTSPTYFRNSLLACLGVPDVSDSVVLAFLNSALYTHLHRAAAQDANQKAFPQVKIRHLQALPAIPHGALDRPFDSQMLRGRLEQAVHEIEEAVRDGAKPQREQLERVERMILFAFDLPLDLASDLLEAAT